jgi:hypothetical protein
MDTFNADLKSVPVCDECGLHNMNTIIDYPFNRIVRQELAERKQAIGQRLLSQSSKLKVSIILIQPARERTNRAYVGDVARYS